MQRITLLNWPLKTLGWVSYIKLILHLQPQTATRSDVNRLSYFPPCSLREMNYTKESKSTLRWRCCINRIMRCRGIQSNSLERLDPSKDYVTYCASRVTAPFPSLHQFHVNLCPTPCCTYIIRHSNNPINPRISPSHNNTKRSVHKTGTLCKQRHTLNSLISLPWAHKCAPIMRVKNIPTQSHILPWSYNLRIFPKRDIRECDS